MNNNKITGLSPGISGTDAVTVSQIPLPSNLQDVYDDVTKIPV